MADRNDPKDPNETGPGGPGTPWMTYLIAVLAVGVAIVGYFILTGGNAQQNKNTAAAMNHATKVDQQAKLNGQ